MSTVGLLTIMKKYQQLKYPPMNDWINKVYKSFQQKASSSKKSMKG